MFNKRVILNIFCSKIPCEIIILTANKKIIKKITLNSSNSTICFCTKGSSIKILAKYNGQTIYKTLRLLNRCQNISVNFVFNASFLQIFNYTFLLRDFNYGFPVLNAKLHFIRNLTL